MKRSRCTVHGAGSSSLNRSCSIALRTIEASSRAVRCAFLTHSGVGVLVHCTSCGLAFTSAPRVVLMARAARVVGRAVCHTHFPNASTNCSAIASGNLRKLVAIIAGLSLIPSAMLPRSPWKGAGGVVVGSRKKNPACAGYREKKTPPLRPSLVDGVNGGGFAVFGTGRIFQHARSCARHLSAAGVPLRERSGRLARQVQQDRGQRLGSCASCLPAAGALRAVSARAAWGGAKGTP